MKKMRKGFSGDLVVLADLAEAEYVSDQTQ